MNDDKTVKPGSLFRKYFITGLVAILPIWITVYILLLIFNIVGGLAKPFLKPFFEMVFDKQPAAILLDFVSFVLTIGIVYLVGSLSTYIFTVKSHTVINKLLSRIPIFNDIYLPVKKLINFLLSQERVYSRVVLVEFPWKGMQCLGFVTAEKPFFNTSDPDMLCVFIPTSPNPTTGFLLFVPKSNVKEVNLNIETAFQMLISGGILHPEQLAGAKEKDEQTGSGA